MLGPDTRSAVIGLTAAMLSVKPLVEGIGGPVRVVPVTRTGTKVPDNLSPGRWRALRALLDRVARRVGVTGLVLSRGDGFGDLEVFDRVVSQRLSLAEVAGPVGLVPVDRLAEVDRVVDAALLDTFVGYAHARTVASPDGTVLSAYEAGAGEEVIVLVPACGMPASLSENWMRHLGRDRRVLTWESRGLFGPARHDAEHATDIHGQAEDLFAVLDHHHLRDAHVVGLCGGAAVALAAAARHPSRIRSLSLWHGAYGFAEDCPQTSHQQGLIELMTAAARSRSAARAVHAAFCQAVLTSTPADVAPLVLYPYADPELLYRYCRLNLGITGAPVEPFLAEVAAPTLVVTSRDDDIAHPEGSRRVAEGLPDGRLRIEPHGDHISLFTAGEELLAVAADFISAH
ncbi:alpha/beta fold hydrolase [Streptomyces anulatus]|uniref:alpha/beta fold hydrolase n=1 Tax=Streptomyces anulatus TaxID=1892 RepID=UPI0036AD080D